MRREYKLLQDKASYLHTANCHLLYNAELLKQPRANLLNSGILQRSESCQKVPAGGRGQAWFLEMPEFSAVLRTYLRGGLIARINSQAYLGLSIENSRSFKEWHLLAWMFDKGLPVPRPIAASACRWPFFFSPFYRAHILLERIPQVETLDQILSQQMLENNTWQSIGACIRRFHDQGVYHADLNANNILLNKKQDVYLIDFDKGEVRSSQHQWKQDNLDRLKRSLLKQQLLHKQYFFSEQDWKALMLAYEK